MPKVKLKTHTKPQHYYRGIDLVSARDALGLSQEQFAAKCGWSQQNQSKLELPGIEHTLTFDMQEAFARSGVYIDTSLKI